MDIGAGCYNPHVAGGSPMKLFREYVQHARAFERVAAQTNESKYSERNWRSRRRPTDGLLLNAQQNLGFHRKVRRSRRRNRKVASMNCCNRFILRAEAPFLWPFASPTRCSGLTSPIFRVWGLFTHQLNELAFFCLCPDFWFRTCWQGLFHRSAAIGNSDCSLALKPHAEADCNCPVWRRIPNVWRAIARRRSGVGPSAPNGPIRRITLAFDHWVCRPLMCGGLGAICLLKLALAANPASNSSTDDGTITRSLFSGSCSFGSSSFLYGDLDVTAGFVADVSRPRSMARRDYFGQYR